MNAPEPTVTAAALQALLAIRRRLSAKLIVNVQNCQEGVPSDAMARDTFALAKRILDDVVSAEGLVKLGRAQQAYEFLRDKRYA